MRSVKLLLFGLMVVVMWSMWDHRSYVVDAYAMSDETSAIRFSGVDLVVDTTPIEPSPLVAEEAPDTRRRPLAVLYTATDQPDEVLIEGGESTLSGTVVVPALPDPDLPDPALPGPERPASPPITHGAGDTSGSTVSVPAATSTTAVTFATTTNSASTEASSPTSSAPGSTDPDSTDPDSTDPGSTVTGSTVPGSTTTDSAAPLDPAAPHAVPATGLGAIVRVERHTADGVATLDVPVNDDGTWEVTGLHGGRYRLRAWVPGLFRSDDIRVLYLESESAETVDFSLSAVDPAPQLTFVDGGPIFQGLTGTVGVSVSQQRVDEDGLLSTSPLPGAVLVATEGSVYRVESARRRVTDTAGSATWRLRCHRTGSAHLRIAYDGSVFSFPMPPCIPIPKPTTTTTTTTTTPPPSQGNDDDSAPTPTSTGDDQ